MLLMPLSYLVLFEICPDSPAFVVGQCMSVFLEKCVDSGDSSVPGVLQIFQSQSSETQHIVTTSSLLIFKKRDLFFIGVSNI